MPALKKCLPPPRFHPPPLPPPYHKKGLPLPPFATAPAAPAAVPPATAPRRYEQGLTQLREDEWEAKMATERREWEKDEEYFRKAVEMNEQEVCAGVRARPAAWGVAVARATGVDRDMELQLRPVQMRGI